MIIRKVRLADKNTATLFGVRFIDGVAQENVNEEFIRKLKTLGNGKPFEIEELEVVPKSEYDALLKKYESLKRKKK